MVKKNRGLGKGLDEIFGGDVEKIIENIAKSKSNGQSQDIDLNKLISNPYQPRKKFNIEELNGLANSIKENGLFTPILIKENGAQEYYIVAGERRVRAAKIAGLKFIPSIISSITDEEMQRITLVENIQREDLNPIEIAKSIESILKTQKIKQEEIANIIGKSRPYVSNLLGMLKLDNIILNSVLNDEINFGHVKPLISLPKNEAIEIYKKILLQNLSVREVEGYAKFSKMILTRKNKKLTLSEKKAQEIIYAEELIRGKLKTKVEISSSEIRIKYKGKEQLSRLLERMEIIEK